MNNFLLEDKDKNPEWFDDNGVFGKFAKVVLGTTMEEISKLPSFLGGFKITWYNTENHDILEKLKSRTKFAYQKIRLWKLLKTKITKF